MPCRSKFVNFRAFLWPTWLGRFLWLLSSACRAKARRAPAGPPSPVFRLIFRKTDPVNDPHELTRLANDPRFADVVKQLTPLARAHVAGKTAPTPER